MADTPTPTNPPPSDDPAAPEGSPPELAMASRQRLTGSAVGIGSVGFDESGAFDVGAHQGDPRDEPEPG